MKIEPFRPGEPAPPPRNAPVEVDLDIFDAGDEDGNVEPRQWLLGTEVCRNLLSGLISAGAGGKTTYRILMMLSLATGRNLSGAFVHKRCRVMIVCLEDDLKELRRRVLAARLHYGVKAEDVKGWLFLTTPKRLKIAERDDKGRVAAGPLLRAIERAVDRLGLDVVCLDPAIKAHSLNENDNPEMDAFASMLVDLAREKNIALDLLSHERKAFGAEPGDVNRGRGAGSVKDAGRIVHTLTGMTKDEAKALGVAEADRKLLIRIDSAKVNVGPPDATTRWFRLVGVALGNGTEDYPNGDNVQTCETWMAPATFSDTTIADINRVLSALGAGMDNGRRYSTAANAGTRAAWKAVQAHFADFGDQRCKDMVQAWENNKLFEVGEYDDPVSRKTATGILSAKLIPEGETEF